MAKMFGKEYLLGIFDKVGAGLDKAVRVFVLGGGAMCFRDQKNSTKDLDLLFVERADTKAFLECVGKSGFLRPPSLESEYRIMGAYAILENPDGFRLDIFSKTVCNALSISNSMAKRAESFGKFGRLEVWLVSNEDVVLFKGITERARDADDIAAVVRSSRIDWGIVLQECISQSAMRKWYGLLYNKLAEVKEKHGISAPIMGELLKLDRRVIIEEAYSEMRSKGKSRQDALAELRKKGFTKKELGGI